MKEDRYCFTNACAAVIEEASPHILKPIAKTDWGNWTDWKNCGVNEVAIGYKFTWEPPQGKGGGGRDDSGGNGFWLRCSNESNGYLIGHSGKWNQGMKEDNCEKGSYVNAIEINSEPNQMNDDDMALTNVKIWCRNPINGQETQLPTPPATMVSSGIWTGKNSCPPFFAVSGVRVKIQQYQHGWDDTMLNKIELRCTHILSFIEAIFVN